MKDEVGRSGGRRGLKLPELEEGPASVSTDESARVFDWTMENVIRKSHAHHHRELLIIDNKRSRQAPLDAPD